MHTAVYSYSDMETIHFDKGRCILNGAATTPIFDGDLEFNRASLYQMRETKQFTQACDF